MSALDLLVEKLREVRPSRQPPGIAPDMLVWAGDTPKGDGAAHALIAETIGYARQQAVTIRRLSRADAHVWLHLLATTSLMHGGGCAPNGSLSEAIEGAFDELGAHAIFFSNCGWSYFD